MIRTSEKIENIAKALASFQESCPTVAFDSTNPFLKNKYASLTAIVSVAKPHLAANRLSILQFLTNEGLVTRILHDTGEWIEGATPMLQIGEEKGKSSAQVLGSIITYLRRYTYSAALGIVSDEDTDGHQLQKPQNIQAVVPSKKVDEKVVLKKQILEALKQYDGDDKDEIGLMLKEKRDNGEDTVELLQNVLKDIQESIKKQHI